MTAIGWRAGPQRTQAGLTVRQRHRQQPGLRRSLTLLEATLGSVGVILGAGIYALVGEAAGRGGNAVWISFLLAALMAGLTGLSYAEMASAYPKAGADYEYTRRGLGADGGAIVIGLSIALVGTLVVLVSSGRRQ
jgi:APA family basic amino acid/polyamine antiporter